MTIVHAVSFSDRAGGRSADRQIDPLPSSCLGYVVVFAFLGIRWFRWETR
jgi:ABC-2 type transport system permease protein